VKNTIITGFRHWAELSGRRHHHRGFERHFLEQRRLCRHDGLRNELQHRPYIRQPGGCQLCAAGVVSVNGAGVFILGHRADLLGANSGAIPRRWGLRIAPTLPSHSPDAGREKHRLWRLLSEHFELRLAVPVLRDERDADQIPDVALLGGDSLPQGSDALFEDYPPIGGKRLSATARPLHRITRDADRRRRPRCTGGGG